MRSSLEPEDLQAIADIVARRLAPQLAELLVAVRRQVITLPQPSESAPAAIGVIVGRTELPQLTGLSTTTLWRMEQQGQFPARIQLSNKRVGWSRAEIEAWRTRRQAA